MQPINAPLVFPGSSGDFIRKAIVGSTVMLEYGAGGSTLVAAERPHGTLVTVESDRRWLDGVLAQCQERSLPGRVVPVHVDIGPTKQWGFPRNQECWHRFPRYSRKPWSVLEQLGLQPDLVLIDGRFRVACFLASCVFASRPTRILFDDYHSRDRYHRVEEIIKPAAVHHDRIAEFHVIPGSITPRFLVENIELFFMANI